MRVLFSCTSGDGHFYPMLPLAVTLRDAGHDVAFAMAEDFRGRVESAGLAWFAAGIDGIELRRRTQLVHRELDGLTGMTHLFVTRFAIGDAPDRAADLHRVVSSWRPDLVVYEPCDLAAPPVAAALGARRVLHSFGRALPDEWYAASERFVAPLWGGARDDVPALCGMYDGAYVDICPPSLHDRDPVPDGTRVLAMRPEPPVSDAVPPAWLGQLPERPSVYVTLGTLFNAEERFRLLLAALADVDCNLIVTTGRDVDAAALGPVPANAFVEQYVPQSLLLPHVDLVVAHGGSGSMLAALAHGLPLLMLPEGADQFENARVCELRGVARVLFPDAVTAGGVRAEVTRLLDDSCYRDRAAEIAEELQGMPSVREVAARLAS